MLKHILDVISEDSEWLDELAKFINSYQDSEAPTDYGDITIAKLTGKCEDSDDSTEDELLAINIFDANNTWFCFITESICGRLRIEIAMKKWGFTSESPSLLPIYLCQVLKENGAIAHPEIDYIPDYWTLRPRFSTTSSSALGVDELWLAAGSLLPSNLPVMVLCYCIALAIVFSQHPDIKLVVESTLLELKLETTSSHT